MVWALLAVGATALAALGVLAALHRAARARLRALHVAGQTRDARIEELERLAVRNRTILQNAMDGFFVLGEDYRFLEVNAAFCNMVGYTVEELLQRKMTDLEVSQPAPEAGEAAQWRTGLHHFATAHRHKDGRLVQLESCVVVLRDEPQKILVGFARDVTERSRAEQALRRSETQYRNLVETSRDLIWSLDLEGRWTFVNYAAKAIYGYEPVEMLGRAVVTDFVRPELREHAERVLEELRAGRPRLRFETEHLRKDGSAVYLSINALPVRDERGNVIGFTGTSVDITYRKDAEERLRAAHARFEALVARMPLGYIVWSRDLRVLEWNPAATAVFGYSADEAMGRLVTELVIPPEGQKAFAEMCRALLGHENSTDNVLVGRRKSGEKITCEWYNTVLPDALGGIQGVATLVRDVSERERFETQLRQSQKLESLGVLAGGVAHDFNNLLVGILGNASLALEKLPANSALRPVLERVVNAGRRASELTQRMLAYAGRASCDVQVMDLNALLAELADFATAAIPKSVKFTIKTAADLPLIEADSGQLQQVILNLLINAAEAIGDAEGEVTVSTWAEVLDAERVAALREQKLAPGAYVCLEVSDTGCGMSPDVLSRAFDPFFTTKFAGRGLGLSAILGIVQAHRGAITCSSQVGVGTMFRVLLPALAAAQQPAAGKPAHAVLPHGSTVLVIDDEEEVRDVVQAVLSSRGIQVLTAADGRQGIEVFRRQAERIDAVLLDINMPGMSGEAVFRELRALNPAVRVVLSTGYSEQEAALHFADAALAGFVHKPYTASMLVEKIGAALAG
jgi:PAS domain S-box-containing protein